MDVFVSLFLTLFLPVYVGIFIVLFLSGTQWKEDQERARKRRLADAKMNARLLRFNI